MAAFELSGRGGLCSDTAVKGIFVLLLGTATVCFSQGTVNFANLAAGVNAPVRDASGQLCVGCMAQLYAGPANTTDPSVLMANGGPAPFLPAQPGYFQGGNRTIGFPTGTTVTFQVRAWVTASGATWDSATERGESNLIQVMLPVSGSVNLIGLQPFSLSVVPEPSSYALAALSAVAFLVFGMRRVTSRPHP